MAFLCVVIILLCFWKFIYCLHKCFECFIVFTYFILFVSCVSYVSYTLLFCSVCFHIFYVYLLISCVLVILGCVCVCFLSLSVSPRMCIFYMWFDYCHKPPIVFVIILRSLYLCMCFCFHTLLIIFRVRLLPRDFSTTLIGSCTSLYAPVYLANKPTTHVYNKYPKLCKV